MLTHSLPSSLAVDVLASDSSPSDFSLPVSLHSPSSKSSLSDPPSFFSSFFSTLSSFTSEISLVSFGISVSDFSFVLVWFSFSLSEDTFFFVLFSDFFFRLGLLASSSLSCNIQLERWYCGETGYNCIYLRRFGLGLRPEIGFSSVCLFLLLFSRPGNIN